MKNVIGRVLYGAALLLLTIPLLAVATACVVTVVASRQTKPLESMPALIHLQNSPAKKNPIVRLHDNKSGHFFCSGTVIASNYVLTAAHCVEERSRLKPSIHLRDMEGNETGVQATAAYYDYGSDLALLSGNFEAFNEMPILTDTTLLIKVYTDIPERPIAACGFPHGAGMICSYINNRRPYIFQFQGMGFLYPGMSGGPVVDILSGYVVGVNTAAFEMGVLVSPLIELLTSARIVRP